MAVADGTAAEHRKLMTDRLRFGFRARTPLIMQSETSECGLASLAMVLCFHGQDMNLVELRRRAAVSLRGTTLADLMVLASRFGLESRALRCEPEDFRQLRRPTILHWEFNHFVVLVKVMRNRVLIHDPALGTRHVSIEEVSRKFTGVALELWPGADFQPAGKSPRMRIRDFFGHIRNLKFNLVGLLCVSLLLQLCALAMPFYMQLMVDEAVVRQDHNLAVILALAFGLLMLVSIATDALRSVMILFAGSSLSFHMAGALARHLLRLPLEWFEKRHLGDIVSRFRSLEPVQNLFSQGAVTIVVDGTMAVTTGIMMFLYSPSLAWIVCAAVVLLLLAELSLYPPIRQRTMELIQASALRDSRFMELARAIQGIKVFGKERERHGNWLHHQAQATNSGIAVGRLEVVNQTLRNFILGAENVLVIFVGIGLVLDSSFTVGMLFAFMSYKGQFTGRLAALIEQVFSVRMLSLHLERLSDIGLTEPEDGPGEVTSLGCKGALSLRDVCYGYGTLETLVLERVSMEVSEGEFISIIGSSGCGKTTLLKLSMGLLRARSGQMLVDDRPIASFGITNLRRDMAAVMQEDHLMAGSIAENISFFDEKQDMDRVQFCAAAVGMDTDISGLPMGYESLIGDMGSVLSMGQRQRLLLARALYKRPKMLFLDEPTANLDAANAELVRSVIASLNMTRVLVTHDEDFARMADRCYLVESGRLREVT